MTFIAPRKWQEYLYVVEMAFGFSPATDPATWTWTDVSRYVRGAVTIQKGRTGMSGQANPTSIGFRLNNTDGRFTAENPMSPYWPNVVLNVPVRVSITWAGAGANYERATAFVGDWPIVPNAGVLDVEVQINATGRLRRLRRSGKTIASAMTYAIPKTSPIAYWPLEDGAASTQAGSGLPGHSPMRVFGVVDFSSGDGAAGTGPLADLSKGGQLKTYLPTITSSSYRIEFVCKFPSFTEGDFVAIMDWVTPTGGIDVWEIDATDVVDGGLYVQWISGATFGGPYFSNVQVDDGQWHHVRIDMSNSGGNHKIVVTLDGVSVINQTTAQAWGVANFISVNPTADVNSEIPRFGQLAVWAPWSATIDTFAEFQGNPGETTLARFVRLCAQQGIQATGVAGLVASQPMGPQSVDTLSNILDSGSDLDNGLLYDGGPNGNLMYTPGSVRCNAPVALTLDYKRSQIGDGYAGTKDDQNYANDTRISRSSGSTAISQDSTRIAIDDDYDQQATVNAFTDAQIDGIAQWRTHVNSFTGYRFPSISIDLRRNPELAQAVTSLTLPARISPINLPTPVYPFGSIDQFAEGYTEILDAVTWQMTFVCTPQPPWRVAAVQDPTNPWVTDCDGHSLNAGVTATATSFSVKNSTGHLMSTSGADYPRDMYVDGEVVTFTAVSGGSSPQTATVTRSVNGVVKSHLANDTVSLYRPATIAL